jgi:hypothetical protein
MFLASRIVSSFPRLSYKCHRKSAFSARLLSRIRLPYEAIFSGLKGRSAPYPLIGNERAVVIPAS